jgi:hypothetical protein
MGDTCLQDAIVVGHISSNPSPQNEQQFETQMQELLCSSLMHTSWEGKGIFNEDINKPICTFFTSTRMPQ